MIDEDILYIPDAPTMQIKAIKHILSSMGKFDVLLEVYGYHNHWLGNKIRPLCSKYHEYQIREKDGTYTQHIHIKATLKDELLGLFRIKQYTGSLEDMLSIYLEETAPEVEKYIYRNCLRDLHRHYRAVLNLQGKV